MAGGGQVMSGLCEAQCCPLVPRLVQPVGRRERRQEALEIENLSAPHISEPLRPPFYGGGRTE